jgi:hypothetical protein
MFFKLIFVSLQFRFQIQDLDGSLIELGGFVCVCVGLSVRGKLGNEAEFEVGYEVQKCLLAQRG